MVLYIKKRSNRWYGCFAVLRFKLESQAISYFNALRARSIRSIASLSNSSEVA